MKEKLDEIPDNSSSKLNCEKCEKVFKVQSRLQIHVNRMHNDHKIYSCDTCGKEFKMNCKLRDHTVFHHESRRKVHCEVCSSLIVEDFNERHFKFILTEIHHIPF